MCLGGLFLVIASCFRSLQSDNPAGMNTHSYILTQSHNSVWLTRHGPHHCLPLLLSLLALLNVLNEIPLKEQTLSFCVLLYQEYNFNLPRRSCNSLVSECEIQIVFKRLSRCENIWVFWFRTCIAKSSIILSLPCNFTFEYSFYIYSCYLYFIRKCEVIYCFLV